MDHSLDFEEQNEALLDNTTNEHEDQDQDQDHDDALLLGSQILFEPKDNDIDNTNTGLQVATPTSSRKGSPLVPSPPLSPTPVKSKKRKRNELEEVRMKVEDERGLESRRPYFSEKSKSLSKVLMESQVSQLQLDDPFHLPEIVVVGMQGEGKSSFIEALVGYQFNYVGENIGTRRPIVIQLQNNTSKQEPICKFKNEEDSIEKKEIPIYLLSSEILRKMEHLIEKHISSKALFLKIEHKWLPNLIIYDFPGFRKEDDKINNKIMNAINAIAKSKSRIIIHIQDINSTPSANSYIQKLDPDNSKTIVVYTKLDRFLEDKEKAKSFFGKQLDKVSKNLFFVSLPDKRNLEGRFFKEQLLENQLKILKSILELNQERYRENLGLGRFKDELENMIIKKLKENYLPNLQKIEKLHNQTKNEIDYIKTENSAMDIDSCKTKVIGFIGSFIQIVEKLLSGSVIGDPDQYGLTLDEERLKSNNKTWPNFNELLDFTFQNSELKLYGGAQYERLLNEFEYVAHSIEFPAPSIHEIASALGTSKSHNAPTYETAASDIVRIKAKKYLFPLIETVLNRMTFILGPHLFEVSIQCFTNDENQSQYSGSFPQFSDSFIQEMKIHFLDFVNKVRENCRSKVVDDFHSFTKVIDWDLISGFTQIKDYDYINCSKEDTKKRVEELMGINKNQWVESIPRGRIVDQRITDHILKLSGKLFAGVRYFFTKYVRAKVNAFFLDPMFQRLGRELMEHFRKLPDRRYELLFNLGEENIQPTLLKLEQKLLKLTKQKNDLKGFLNQLSVL